MRNHRRTLSPMDLDQLDRILADVCDVIDAQGGDWDATEAVLLERFTGEALDNAYVYATAYLIAYGEPGGPEFVRGMRDRRRRLVPTIPRGGQRRWPWQATG